MMWPQKAQHNHNCCKGNSSAGAAALMETRCHLTNVPIHKSSRKRLLQLCNLPLTSQPPGNTSKLNWLLMQGWVVNSTPRETWQVHEVTRTELTVTRQRTGSAAEKPALEPQRALGEFVCNTYDSTHPAGVKIGRNNKREKPASPELCVCVRSMQAEVWEMMGVLTKH